MLLVAFSTLTFPPSSSSQVFGGSGSHLWSVEDNNGVIAVSSKGMITALVRGSSSVKVTDQKNALHFDIVKV